MKTLDLFNLYMGESRPGPSWSEREIGCLTVRLADDYDVKVSKLSQPQRQIISEAGLQILPERKGTWQATATVSWDGPEEKSILLNETADDGGQWDLCHLLTFLTGRHVATAEYRERFSPQGYGDYAVAQIDTLRATALAWQNRNCLVAKNLHIALLLYNAAMNADLLQSRAALYCTALNIILDQHHRDQQRQSDQQRQRNQQKVNRRLKKKLKNAISDILAKTKELQPDQAEQYERMLHRQVNDGPTLSFSLADKLVSLLQSLEIIDTPPTPDQKTRAQHIIEARNALTHTGRIPTRIPNLKGLNAEQSGNYTANIVAAVIPEIIRIVIGNHLGFRPGGTGSHCIIKDDVIDFFQNGVFRDMRFVEICEYLLEKNAELYQRLS